MAFLCVVLLLHAPVSSYKTRSNHVKGVSDLYPYEYPEVVGTKPLYPVSTGVMKPTFATIYSPIGGDISFYIAPAQHCHAVYVCFSSNLNQNDDKEFEQFHVEKICHESLRFLPLEQTVYHVSKGQTKAYVHFKAIVEFIHIDGSNDMIYKYEAWSDLIAEDISQQHRTVTIKFNLTRKKIVVFTSSPYCHVTLDQEYAEALFGHQLIFEPRKDYLSYLKFHSYDDAAHFIVSGSAAGSTMRRGLRRSTSFFDPSRKFSQPYDCCSDPTEFDGFVKGSYWDPEYLRPKFNRYSLTTVKRNREVCGKSLTEDDEYILFQSFVIEIGQYCEWILLCFDTEDDRVICAQDANMLGLVLAHEVYIPTDSDDARALSLPYGEIGTIRLNFLKNAPAIEMSYGFFSLFTSGIIDTMQLDSYQRMLLDISKIRVTMVRAPLCQARLTNVREVILSRSAKYF